MVEGPEAMCLSPYTEERVLHGTGDAEPDRSAVPDALERRLLKAVASYHRWKLGSCEVAVLLGHALRRCRSNSLDCRIELGGSPDPDDPVWHASGLSVVSKKAGAICLELDARRHGIFAHPDVIRAAGGASCRSFAVVPGDPWMLRLARRPDADPDEWPTYRSEGQAQAIRGLSALPPGGVALVLLPTGGGKSMCIHYAVATASSHTDLAVVVVPTVALALDQERELQKVIKDIEHPTAYVGGPDARVRDDIRKRVREGTQRVVFTSPESLMGSLFHALLDAARNGRLAWLLVDEAHIIDSWGEGFRPEFRLLAGFRRAILRETPARVQRPRTALLTATASAHVVDSLRQQMFDPGVERPMPHWCVVGCLTLRTEHRYIASGHKTVTDKEEAVWEALHALPRPVYLYATKRGDVDAWYERLWGRGFRRIAKVHGGSSTGDRRSVLSRLEEEEVDVVIANSAFGLGVNQSDVRSVLHVGVPEDLDRYYQEVGRAGRDGNAAVAVLLHDPVAVNLAREMSAPQSIGKDRGLRRLRDMWAHNEDADGERIFRLPLNKGPMGNSRHEEWDRLTLVLLAEAGVLSLEAVPSPRPVGLLDRSSEEAEDASAWAQSMCVTLWDPRLLQSDDAWQSQVEPIRARRTRLAKNAFQEVEAFLEEPGSLWGGLCRTYTIEIGGRTVAPPLLPGTSELLRVQPQGNQVAPGCWEPLGSARCWFVGWPRSAFAKGAWQELARRALQQGFRWFLGDLELVGEWARGLPPHERDRVILSAQAVSLHAPPMPWVAVVSGDEALAWEPLARTARSQAGMVFLPADTPNAGHGIRRLSEDLGAAWLAPEDAAQRLGT